MHSNNKPSTQGDLGRTFIEQARRAQIIEATVDVLAQYGYLNASFVRIAKHAGISASLISYHFKNKEELMDEVIKWVEALRINYVKEKLAEAQSATDKLRIAIEADVANMGTRVKYFHAGAEILFSKRSRSGSLIYHEGRADLSRTLLADILKEGQANGEFGEFDIEDLTWIIDSSRDSFLAHIPIRSNSNLEKFSRSLVTFALKATQKEKTS